MSANKLIFKDAVKAKTDITKEQKKELSKLYRQWSDDIMEKSLEYGSKSTKSAPISKRQMDQLDMMLVRQANIVAKEAQGLIEKNIYLASDAVIKSNKKWMSGLGFDQIDLDINFNHVNAEVVEKIVTGQIYDSGWSLSKRIWGDNEDTLAEMHKIIAGGHAKNKSMYEIAKDLESYVKPSAKKNWNLKDKNGKKIYPKQVDYNAQRLGRTLVQHGYQQSFRATTIDNPLINDYIWNSNGSRVCPICKERDGQHYKKGEEPMDHPNGMCILVPDVSDNLVDDIADWFNGDKPSEAMDKFASNFGYSPEATGGPIFKSEQDIIDKYGKSKYKSLGTWYKKLDIQEQKEIKILKDKSGLTWDEWYNKHIYNGDELVLDDINIVDVVSDKIDFDSMTNFSKIKDKMGIDFTDSYKMSNFMDLVYELESKGISKKDLDNFEEYLFELVNNDQKNKDYLSYLLKDEDMYNNEAYFKIFKDALEGNDIVNIKDKDKFIKETSKIFPDVNLNLPDSVVKDIVEEKADDVIDEATKKIIEEIEKDIVKFEKSFNKIKEKQKDMVFSNLWVDDVKPSDYLSKKKAIKNKKKYFEEQIDLMNSGFKNFDEDLKDKYLKNLDDLAEFEKQGKKYEAYKNQLEKKAKELKQYTKPKFDGTFDQSLFDDEVKKAAAFYKDRHDADVPLRNYLNEIWDDMTEWEKYSVYEYTRNSNPLNRSLSGYHDGWDRYNFKGLGNTKLSHENNYSNRKIKYENLNKFAKNGQIQYEKVVENLTTCIEKSEFQENIWVVRGSESDGLAGLLESDLISYDDAYRLISNGNVDELKDLIVGNVFKNESFTSTGIAQDAGFSGNVRYEIYCPKGTKGIYAEPQSHYGDTVLRGQLYEKGDGYNYVGSEAEIIIQRGTEYRIIDVEKSWGNYKIKMEIVRQPNYFETGLEQTFNNGQTSWKD